MSAVGTVNRQFVLTERPSALPDNATFAERTAPVAEPAPGEAVVRTQYISIDPAMRMWVNDARSYAPPVAIGEVMRAIGGGEVVASAHPDFREGDLVTGFLGVQQFATVPGADLSPADPALGSLPLHLSAFGLTGMSAYFGLLEIGRPAPGETVVVSAAAGAVGSTVGQIAKIKGCRVIGIAGGEDKCRFVVEQRGFDAAIDYKAENVAARLAELCPDRIDIYYDNVGGEILDAALGHLAHGARVVVSGAISQYNSTALVGPANYLALAVDRARMEGFIVTDYAERFPQATHEMAAWIRDGKLASDEQILRGLDAFPEALLRLFSGQTRGKLLLDVSADD